MGTSSIQIIPYTRRYKRDLLRLTQHEDRLHIHLDWNSVDEWVGEPDMPIFLAWRDRKLVGAIGTAPPLGDTTWLRLAAFSPEIEIEEVLEPLWWTLVEHLQAVNVHEVAILLLWMWIKPYIEKLGFTEHDSIITLRRDGQYFPSPLRSDIQIRVADWRDVSFAVVVDHAAFAPIWQLTPAALRQAARSSARFTLAELNGRVIGYEISTLYRDGAHLARLATLPDVQGTGVGGAMVGEAIHHFIGRNVRSYTVNTQRSNTQSLSLYKRYGFEFTGLNMDVWSIRF